MLINSHWHQLKSLMSPQDFGATVEEVEVVAFEKRYCWVQMAALRQTPPRQPIMHLHGTELKFAMINRKRKWQSNICKDGDLLLLHTKKPHFCCEQTCVCACICVCVTCISSIKPQHLITEAFSNNDVPVTDASKATLNFRNFLWVPPANCTLTVTPWLLLYLFPGKGGGDNRCCCCCCCCWRSPNPSHLCFTLVCKGRTCEQPELLR